ncbi:hypothetical protein BGW42_007810 [Actinomortierella wolfii]|nr:hypothetical protein BGW42_007810 [Actinomortierella wolfii]
MTRDIAQFLAAKSIGTHAPLEVCNQDIFEATYRVPALVAENDASWKEWGFSEDDIDNFKTFLFGGTAFNNGTLLVTPPSLLADVSNIVVGLLFGICLFMVVLALILSRGVPAMVRDPISEILPEIKASQKRWDSSSSSISPDTETSAISTSFLKRRVAHLTLEHQPLPDIESDSKNASTTSLIPSKSPPRRGRLVLRMEIDGDDEDESIELLETVKNRD